MNKFIKSELLPIETPVWLNLEKFIFDGKHQIERNLRFKVYESGKVREITVINPAEYEAMFQNWVALEKEFTTFLKENAVAVSPMIWGAKQYEDKLKNKDFSDRYFLYRNSTKYSKMVQRVQQKLESGRYKYCSKLDVKDYFGSITLDTLERALSNQGVDEFLKNKKDNKYAGLWTKIEAFAKPLFQNHRGLPVGLNISKVLSEIIGIKIDRTIANVYDERFRAKAKIFRYIDDFYVLHNHEIDNDFLEMVEEKLTFYNINFYRNCPAGHSKTKLNLESLEKQPYDWNDDQNYSDVKSNARVIQNYFIRLLNAFENGKSKSILRYLKTLRSHLASSGEGDMDFLKGFKTAHQMVLLKLYTFNSKTVSLQLKKEVELLSYDLLNVFVKLHNRNKTSVALLNTFAANLVILKLSQKSNPTKKVSELVEKLSKLEDIYDFEKAPVLIASALMYYNHNTEATRKTHKLMTIYTQKKTSSHKNWLQTKKNMNAAVVANFSYY